jgi:hypothetical protein
MRDNDREIKVAAPINGVALVQNPEVIRVLAINKRILEQLPWADGEPGSHVERKDYNGIQILGATEPYGIIIIREANGDLARLRGSAFTSFRMSQGKTIEEAHAEIGTFPQMFEG